MAARKAGRRKADKQGEGTGPLGFEAKLWQAADALRNNMDAAEYKHVVLGLIFLKYISDAFEAKHAELEAEKAKGADPEDPDEYRAASIFWVPKEARWQHLKASAPQPTIGMLVDDAMTAIERDNPSLKGTLPKDFARPGLDKQRLGQVHGDRPEPSRTLPSNERPDVTFQSAALKPCNWPVPWLFDRPNERALPQSCARSLLAVLVPISFEDPNRATHGRGN